MRIFLFQGKCSRHGAEAYTEVRRTSHADEQLGWGEKDRPLRQRMPDIFSLYHEDHHLCNIGGMVGDPLQ